jgi:tRNA threonylcarbamoyladenosine biosynthesis protein TsaB
MLILGIETATIQAGCAIGGHEGVLAMAQSAKGRRHAETLAPAIQFICQQADITLDEISVVAVDIGPGLFTGLRVGVATAKALAHAIGVPMIGVASLDLLAFPLRFSPKLVVAAIDARRGELYYSFYRQVPGGIQRLGDHRIATPDDLASELSASSEEILLVGDGAHRYQETFANMDKVELADSGLNHPSASSLVHLAHARALREQFERAAEIDPIYLRKPDAEINWAVRERAPGSWGTQPR